MPPKKRHGAKSRKTSVTGVRTQDGGEQEGSTKRKDVGQNQTPIVENDELPVVTSFPPEPISEGIGASWEAQPGSSRMGSAVSARTSKLKYKQFKRTTLLEELQSILTEYPDNEQIIKELIQNAEDADARVVKIGFCPSSNSDHLEEPYREYLSGPALCFYNDSIFEEEDWEGITMVRKSNKQDNPLKVGKFGIGFKSVFHITDSVCIISGEKILFLDPLREFCPFNTLEEFTSEDICGPRGLEALYGLFDISKETVQNGKFDGSFFWFPLRKSASSLSDNIYTPGKAENLFNCFKKEIAVEILFLTSVEEIRVFKVTGNTFEIDYSVSVDASCLEKVRIERTQYKEKLRKLEVELSRDDHAIHKNHPILMKTILVFKVQIESRESFQKWLVVQYFHAGTMNEMLSQMIRNQRCKHRPYGGIAARLDAPILSGKIFCSLPLPSTHESSTGLPVHVHGCFALDSNRQHLKWPSHDQTVSNSHLERDMTWNVLMVEDVLPIVYKAFLNSWWDDLKCDMINHLEMFFHYIPRQSKVRYQWKRICELVQTHILNSEMPCLREGNWIKLQDAYVAIFKDDIPMNMQLTVMKLFELCTNKTITLEKNGDLYDEWLKMGLVARCTSPSETRRVLKTCKVYEQLSPKEKADLLVYCCSDGDVGLSDLDGIELIPVSNGCFEKFSKGKSQNRYYLCEENELELLVGMETCLVQYYSTEVGDVLKSLASSEIYNFQRLDETAFFKLLDNVALARGNNEILLVENSGEVFGDKWLQSVWKYLNTHCQNTLQPVADLHLVKTKDCNILRKLSECFISYEGIDSSMKNILEYFNIWTVDSDFHGHHLMQPGKGIVFQTSDYEKEKLLLQCIEKGIDSFNSLCPEKEKELFKEFLPNTTSSCLISAFRKLKMFKCFSRVNKMEGYVSVKECNLVYIGNRDFPISFPQNMIIASSKKETRLLKDLGLNSITLTDVVEMCIKKIKQDSRFLYEREERRRFCFYILSMHSSLTNWSSIQASIVDIKFIENEKEETCSANELYDPKDELLRNLFCGESKFPAEKREKKTLLTLTHLQFLGRNSVTLKTDVVATCRLLHSNSLNISQSSKKSKALIQIFTMRPDLFNSVYNSIKDYKIMHYQTKRPENYPTSLEWYSSKMDLVSINETYSEEFRHIIGSVSPTMLTDWESLLMSKVGSSEVRSPSPQEVIQQFRKITECYCEEEHDDYYYLMKKLYQHVSKQPEIAFQKTILPDKCILTEQGFMRPENTYIETSKQDLNLTPYFVPLQKEYKTMKAFFERLGCKTKQTSRLLVEVLYKIKDRHSLDTPVTDYDHDLNIVQQVLKTLTDRFTSELSKIKDEIIVPIHKDGNRLIFRRSEECVFSDRDWFSRKFTDDDNIILVHSKIDKEVAKVVGVRSLKEFTLSDAEDILSEFGQSEPLTYRINCLLKEGYTDGLSVPKELIQNADDAGASEVCFLYDERENVDARSCLLDPGMQSCQGPALWVFNDAEFTSEDFENIQKLSGATKKDKPTKIGKFGLGFNAVYNLTDVPSFVSGNHLVYLDPHSKYLGNAIMNKNSPGIKLNLHNKLMLQKLENQFKPFQNVFHFTSREFLRGERFNGTLFRFPLRTKEQAATSEILGKAYSKLEMEDLLKMFCRTCGNLLLFTQNVQCIKLFHLDRQCSNPDKEMELVLSVQKNEKWNYDSEQSILSYASKFCNQAENWTAVCKSQIIMKGICHPWLETGEPTNQVVPWIIAWSTGVSNTLEVIKTKNHGALPVSCVAVPVDSVDKSITPLLFNDCTDHFENFGFYDVGHLFCFLPLPIQTKFNFHVNGMFAVSSDRQRLLMHTEDDKHTSDESLWNTSLISDATVESLIQLLLEFKNMSSEKYRFTILWPVEISDDIWKEFQKQFFKALVERPLPLFKTHCGWKSFQECLFLHPEIYVNEKLKSVAFRILRNCPLDGKVITDLPCNVFNTFQNCIGKDFEKHILTYENFFIKSFLPSLSSFQRQEYDVFVLEAIKSKNENILSAINSSECIRTRDTEILKVPEDLVHPESPLKEIFVPDSEYFPNETFCSGEVLDILVTLGMMKERIPWDRLLLQTKAITHIASCCSSCAVIRSHEIMKYIHTVFSEIPMEVKQELSHVPFLPVKIKPKNWPLKWYIEDMENPNILKKCAVHGKSGCGESTKIGFFEKPSNLYFDSTENLVACTETILDRYYEDESYNFVLTSLGVKCKKNVKQETLKLQLQAVVANPENAQNIAVEKICYDIYGAMEEYLMETDWQEFVKKELSDIPCILINGSFICAKQVVLQLEHDCSPYLYGLQSTSLNRYSKFMETIGVRKKFAAKDITGTILCIKDNYNEQQLSETELSLVCRIVNLLEQYEELPALDLYLPDSKGYFEPLSSLCIDDCDWIPTSDSMMFLNEKVTPKVAKLLGVKSKRTQNIMDDSEEFGDEFGQYQELTSRIRCILDGYPECSILKELLQNADDAGATELHFVIDYRSHGTEHVFSEEWKELQGPALCVYNNSAFSDVELKGIQDLGTGSKKNDATSLGQYGVGFNAVYNITDAPSFYSRDVNQSMETLCILDPQCKYIPWASEKKPGRIFRDASKVQEKYKDIIPCYLQDTELWKGSQGTLFRFPLRTEESKLSSRRFSCDDIEKLLMKFTREVPECLLFLQNTKTVIFSKITADGAFKQDYCVRGKHSTTDCCELFSSIVEAVQQMKKNPIYACTMQRKEVKTKLTLDINGKENQEWLIVKGFGFLDQLNISEVKDAYEKKKLALLPIAGVAIFLNRSQVNEKNKIKLSPFKTYCGLPLPDESGLPVHVNGQFALDNETRKHIEWTESHELKFQWNRCLIENVIAPTYACAIQHFRDELFPTNKRNCSREMLEKFHNIFPVLRTISRKESCYVAKMLYKCLYSQRYPVFPIVRSLSNEAKKNESILVNAKSTANAVTKDSFEVSWTALPRDYMSLSQPLFYSSNEDHIVEVLRDLGMTLINFPWEILKSMIDADLEVGILSPNDVVSFLKTYRMRGNDGCALSQINVPVSCTQLKSEERVLKLLEYCEGRWLTIRPDFLTIRPDFENCPLLLSADGYIRRFSKCKRLYMVHFPSLFPKSAEEIVHPKLFSFFSESRQFVDFVENLTIEDIYRQVHANITYNFCVGKTIPWPSSVPELPDKEWISCFWLQIFKLFKHRYERADEELQTKLQHLLKQGKNTKKKEIILCQTSLTNLEKNILESFCAELLNQMGNFSCIPVCIKERKTCKHFLFPLKKCNAVLFVKETRRQEDEILTSMKVPVIHSECSPIQLYAVSDILRTLMATVDESVSILNCIYTNKNELQVDYSVCHNLLNYFQTHAKDLLDERENKDKLLCLPIFQSISKKVVAVNDKTAIIVPEEIPEEGLSHWCKREGIEFILENRHLQSLFNALRFPAVDKHGVYIKHILPNFESLPHDAVIQHMIFIRDTILPPLLNNKDMKCNLDKVKRLLHEIAFLQIADGTLVRPCQLYNRHSELFMLKNRLCSESELPPEPYHTKEWESFLIFCGMKNDFTEEVFCDFASRLQALGDAHGITKIVKENSRRLIGILKETPDLLKNNRFVNKMKNIRFLCPQHPEPLCKMLLPEAKSNETLVAYNNSAYSHSLHLVWSKMNVISENTNPFCSQETSDPSKLLGISDPPPLQTVVAHITSLCNNIQSDFSEKICRESGVEENFAKIMEDIYRYLEKYGTTWSEKILHQVPFIFLRERKILVTADRVVLRLREEDEIIPYLCKPSAHFGQFHTLLEKHGSHTKVKSSHCASVLKGIYQKSKGDILEPSDIERVQRAIRLLFQTIEIMNDIDFTVTNLFLLTRKNKLEDSRNMIFVDNVHLEKRISENKLKSEYFVGFKNLKMNVMDQMTEIKFLPERCRPLLLSDLIKEDLTVESRHTVLNSDSAQHLQSFLHSVEFFLGICRLILHECAENETAFSRDEQIDVQTKLQAIHVVQLEDLKTVLKYNDSELPKTEEDTSIFTKMVSGDDFSLCLYFKMGREMDMNLWIAENSVPLSKTLNCYLSKGLGNQTICLPSILGCICNAHLISSVLDRLKIVQIDMKLPAVSPFMPEIGAEIPVSCHYLVNNSCTVIAKNEYIAYELFDPIVDEDDPGVCNLTPVYIFAKVVETLSQSTSQIPDASNWQMRYKVNVGGQVIVSDASRVYSFLENDRRNAETCDNDVDDTTALHEDDDQVRIHIRDVMKNAIKKSKPEFRRSFKRLYLQYHPDEHIHNKGYFHRLIQFICFVHMKLERKEPVENADILTTFERDEEQYMIPVLERICSVRLNEYRKNRQECHEKCNSSFFENFCLRGPQPGQSRRWFRQAETDFKAASTDEYEPNAYNWACYKCHQAVEKALKALQYQLDADKVSLNMHSLSTMASTLADVKLSGLVGQLEGITGDYFCMRYPDAVHEGHISSDLYTEDQAKRAIERTREILQIVRERLRSS